MRHWNVWARQSSALLTVGMAMLGIGGYGAMGHPGDELKRLDLQRAWEVPLNDDLATVVQADGSRKETRVALKISCYEATISRVGVPAGGAEWQSRPCCFTLSSKAGSAAYSWSLWAHEPFGLFRLITSGHTSYLAWIEYSSILFADASRSNDKLARLSQHLSWDGEPRDAVRVPVYSVFPEVRNWGVNAAYNDITVRSIAKNKAGNWVVQFSGPKSDKIYTVVSDKSAPYGWRLRE